MAKIFSRQKFYTVHIYILAVCTITVASSSINMTPSGEDLVCPGQHMSIVCSTEGATISYFASKEYIGDNRRIEVAREFFNQSRTGYVSGSNAMVTVTGADEVNGMTLLEFELCFTVTVGTVVICGSDYLPGAERNVTLIIGTCKSKICMCM